MITGYIGSYTKENGKGIYKFTIDEDKKVIHSVETGYEVQASTYIAKYQDHLYGIKKSDDQCGIQSYQIESDEILKATNDVLPHQSTGCHISISHDGKYLLEAVYGDGVVRLYALDKDLNIERFIDTHQQKGNGPNKERQDNAHTHFIQETADHKYAVAVDLGTDEVITFSFGEDGFEQVHALKVAPGSGPRHLVFHENGKYAYLFTELSNEVMVLEYNQGQFKVLETYQALPEDFDGHSQGAAVRMSHDQRFVYVSNRGHQSITVYEVLGNGEALKNVGCVESGGDWPRDFNIDPSDRFLVCAHERSGHLVLFERDIETGLLTMVDNTQKAPEGVCVIFN